MSWVSPWVIMMIEEKLARLASVITKDIRSCVKTTIIVHTSTCILSDGLCLASGGGGYLFQEAWCKARDA